MAYSDRPGAVVSVSCPECGKEVKGPAQLKIHQRTHGKLGPLKDVTIPVEPQSPFEESTPTDPLGGAPIVEPTPVEPKKGWRLWAKDKPAEESKPTAERKPSRPAGRRVDASRMLGDGWGALGRAIERRFPAYLPAARALQAEATAAGPIVSDLVRGTLVDRPVQFAARHYEAGSVALSLLALPAYVQKGGMELLETGRISPATHGRIEDCILDLAPSMVKWAKREAKRRADVETSLEEMREVLGIPDGQPVTIDALFGFFYPVGDPIPTTATVKVA